MELKELREQIDLVDRELIALLERRMDISAQISDWKRKAGAPILDMAREEAKLASVRTMCRESTADGIADVFREIMAASRALQAERMRGD